MHLPAQLREDAKQVFGESFFSEGREVTDTKALCTPPFQHTPVMDGRVEELNDGPLAWCVASKAVKLKKV